MFNKSLTAGKISVFEYLNVILMSIDKINKKWID